MDLKTYETVISILRLLIKDTKFDGHVYSVGGCERDRILGNEIKDIDIVVDLPRGGIELAEYLYNIKQLVHAPVIYENFGTCMFKLIDCPTIELEAVHTRKETYRGNSRKPETAYGTIEEDCTRRDFTINAVYRNISTGETLDLNGNSRQDLQNKLIRTCGDPNVIFSEDPLRILRAIRFKYRLDYQYDTETFNGMFKYTDRLSIISQERITDEFSKILCGNNAGDAIHVMQNLDMLKYIFPIDESVIKNNILSMKNRMYLKASKPNLIVRLAILFRDLAEWDVKGLVRAMKYPNDVADDIIFLHKFTTDYRSYNDGNQHFYLPNIRKAMYYSKTLDKFKLLTDYLEAIGRDGQAIYMTSIFEIGDIMYGYKLGVNGDDIMNAFGIKPGPQVKDLLGSLIESAFVFPEIYKKKDCCLMKIEGILNNAIECY